MITPSTITYDAAQARADELRGARMPRSTRARSAGATRRASLARRVRFTLRIA